MDVPVITVGSRSGEVSDQASPWESKGGEAKG